MKKITMMALVIIIGIMLTACGESDSYETYSESISGAEDIVEETSEEVSEKESVSESKEQNDNVEPEDTPAFLRGLGTVKNSNGTFSFCGCITAYQFPPYGGVDPTIYITSLNGHEFSTGAADAFMRQYIGNNGEISVMLNDILYDSYNIKGIVFEFTFDAEGNIVNIVRA